MTVNHDPEDYARALLSFPRFERVANVDELAERMDLSIRDVESTNFEGALVRIPERSGGIIAVNRAIRELGRRNFTIAHEIGHFILPGHGIEECHCKSAEIESWRKNVIRAQEFEANRFASEYCSPLARSMAL